MLRTTGVTGSTVRNSDVVSASSAVAGPHSLDESPQRPASPSPLQLRLTLLLVYLVSGYALQGCAGLVMSEATPSIHERPHVDRPLTIRTLGSDGRFSQLSSATVAQQLRTLQAGESLNILALSGGGAFSAFAAGAIVGL